METIINIIAVSIMCIAIAFGLKSLIMDFLKIFIKDKYECKVTKTYFVTNEYYTDMRNDGWIIASSNESYVYFERKI